MVKILWIVIPLLILFAGRSLSAQQITHALYRYEPSPIFVDEEIELYIEIYETLERIEKKLEDSLNKNKVQII